AALRKTGRRVVQLRAERAAAARDGGGGKRQLRRGRAHERRSANPRRRPHRSLAAGGGARLRRLSRSDPRAAGGSMTHPLDVRTEDLKAATAALQGLGLALFEELFDAGPGLTAGRWF